MMKQTTLVVALALMTSGCGPSSSAVDPQAKTSPQNPAAVVDSTAGNGASDAVARGTDGGQAMPAGDVAADNDAQGPTTPGMPLPAATCAADGYAAFFEQFVENANIREAYTAANVEVGITGKPTRPVEKSGYDDFRIGIVDSRWVYLDPAIKDVGELPLLDVDIKQDDGKTLRIEYKTAIPEDGNAPVMTPVQGTYTFRHQANCWYLTGDLH